MTEINMLARALEEFVAGDVSCLTQVSEANHSSLVQARETIFSLLLTKAAVLRVLDGLRKGVLPVERVQQWASFMRRGYIAGGADPICPIEIEWEMDGEERISEVLSRLDELEDIIDGTIDDNELARMIASLHD